MELLKLIMNPKLMDHLCSPPPLKSSDVLHEKNDMLKFEIQNHWTNRGQGGEWSRTRLQQLLRVVADVVDLPQNYFFLIKIV